VRNGNLKCIGAKQSFIRVLYQEMCDNCSFPRLLTQIFSR